jgi:hypothetical protein
MQHFVARPTGSSRTDIAQPGKDKAQRTHSSRLDGRLNIVFLMENLFDPKKEPLHQSDQRKKADQQEFPEFREDS